MTPTRFTNVRQVQNGWEEQVVGFRDKRICRPHQYTCPSEYTFCTPQCVRPFAVVCVAQHCEIGEKKSTRPDFHLRACWRRQTEKNSSMELTVI